MPIEDWHGIAVAYRRLGLMEKTLKGELEQDRGHLDHAKGHFDQAKEYYEAALEIWRKLGDQRETSSILANMGHLLIAQAKYSEARSFLERALAIRREIKDTSRISTTLRGLGQLDELEGKLEKAANNYLEALTTASLVGDTLSAGRAALALAGLASKQSNYREAIRLAAQAREFFHSLNETADIERDIKRADELLEQIRALQG